MFGEIYFWDKKKFIFIPIISGFVMVSCETKRESNRYINTFRNYYSELKKGSDDKWNYTTDTVKVWWDDKDGDPILQIKGKESIGPWRAWDEEMNSSTKYDTLWFDKEELAVKVHFVETNDFYKLIGKNTSKTLQTFWFNSEGKIKEKLIYWIPEENTISSEHLKPIVEWAMENDSIEISQLYGNGQIIPSRANAIRWKKLLKKYNTFKMIDKDVNQ